MDETMTKTEFDLQGYTQIRNDRARHSGSVVIYIKEGIGFKLRDVSSEFENIFIDLLLPKIMPILVGILFISPIKLGGI